MYDVTFEELISSPIREGLNQWMIFSDARADLHIADFHYLLPTVERRDLQRYVTRVMNGVMKPPRPGVWSYHQKRVLAYNGHKAIVISKKLPLEVRDRYLAYMLHVLNNGRDDIAFAKKFFKK